MSFRPNPLSNFGRMSYGVHLLVYPTLLAIYVFGVTPYMARRNKIANDTEWASMPKAKKVDPDLFNPFTPIPYHNNTELRYAFAKVNMFNYINENQLNSKTYVYKGYHNSFDHDN